VDWFKPIFNIEFRRPLYFRALPVPRACPKRPAGAQRGTMTRESSWFSGASNCTAQRITRRVTSAACREWTAGSA
jgi:hypothetical protein